MFQRIQVLYVISLALSLTLHIFNFGGDEGLKPFHIAAVLSCCLSFCVVPQKTYLHFLLLAFLLCVMLSSVFSPVDGALKNGIIIVIVMYSCYGMAYVDIKKLLKYLVVLILFDSLVLMVYAIQNPTYRYCGFYNDPNYLCSTLTVMLFMSLVAFSYYKKLVIRVVLAATIVLILGIVMMTLSRTGVATCLLLLLCYSVWNLRENFRKTIVIIAVGLCLLQFFAGNFIEGQWGLLYDRLFTRGDNLESAEGKRQNISLQNLRFIADNPGYIFFGLGPSGTSPNSARQITGLNAYRADYQRDHNTWTSCLVEQGLLAFIVMILLFRLTALNVFRVNDLRQKYLMLGLMGALLLFSLSIWQMNYLPFWWAVFLLNNEQLAEL